MAIKIDDVAILEDGTIDIRAIEPVPSIGPAIISEKHINISADILKKLMDIVDKSIKAEEVKKAKELGYIIGAYYNVKVLNKDTGHTYYRITKYDSIGFAVKGNEQILKDAPISKIYDHNREG